MRFLLQGSLLLNLGLMISLSYVLLVSNVVTTDDRQPEDTREVLRLSTSEGAFMMKEMRGLLETMEGVLLALDKGQMQELAKIARKRGMADMVNVPKSFIRKVPKGFKTFARGMHVGWDEIAEEAETMGDKNEVVKLIVAQFSRCTGCHKIYKLK